MAACVHAGVNFELRGRTDKRSQASFVSAGRELFCSAARLTAVEVCLSYDLYSIMYAMYIRKLQQHVVLSVFEPGV